MMNNFQQQETTRYMDRPRVHRQAAVRPSTSERVLADRASKKPGFWISFSVARPQAVATGLPDSVPAW